MPCTKCSSDFNVLNWKFCCGECKEYYCTKCLKKLDGILYCDKCVILMKRPPDREKLMQLRSKDLQDYLNKNNISTRGLVEKQELVELLCKNHIPIPQKRGAQRFTANFGGSVPNLTVRSQAYINSLRTNVENVFTNAQQRSRASDIFSTTTSPTREMPSPRRQPPPRPQPPQFTQPTTSKTEPASNSSQPNQPRYPKLSDFDSVDELCKLSTKQLKELLTLNRVDYKGCVEKTELLERAERLWNDSKRYNKEDLPDSIEDLCKLCMDAPLDCILLECGHIATCIDCGKQLAECPICRQYVTRVVRIFKA